MQVKKVLINGTRIAAVLICILMVMLSSPAIASAIDFTTNSDGSITIEGGSYPNLNGSSATSILSNLFSNYKALLMFAITILTATIFFYFVYMCFRLSTSGTNEQQRQKAYMGLASVITGIILLGSASIWIGMAYNFGL